MNNSIIRPLASAAGALCLGAATIPAAAQDLHLVEALSLPSGIPEASLGRLGRA